MTRPEPDAPTPTTAAAPEPAAPHPGAQHAGQPALDTPGRPRTASYRGGMSSTSTELVRANLRRQKVSIGMVVVSLFAATLFARKRLESD